MNSLQILIEHIAGYPIEWSETAAWVQAIGAVAAIGFTAQQVASLAKMERERRATPLEMCCVGAQQALELYDNFRATMAQVDDVPRRATSTLQTGFAKQISGPFNEVRLTDMPNREAVHALLVARIQVDWFIMRVQAAADGRPGWDDGSLSTRTSMVIAWERFQLERDRIRRPVSTWWSARLKRAARK